MTHPDVEATLDILRLMNATGAMTEANDYELYSTAAAEQGNYVEALAVLNNGVAAKRIDPAGSQFRDLIAGLKAKPQATEADLAEAAKTAPAAKTLIGIGDRYYGLGNYAKAAETYRAALAKPDANADIANLHIGMALARAGDKAGAAAALARSAARWPKSPNTGCFTSRGTTRNAEFAASRDGAGTVPFRDG